MTASISLVTPSYSGDFDCCKLLCESIDRHVTGHDMHYIVVGDEDAALFAPLNGPRRRVVLSSSLLPKFWALPKWRGRRYWWSPAIHLPVYGWHLQQLRKIAMTLAQSSERVMCVDSDNVFCRPLDLSEIAATPRLAHYVEPGAINQSRPNHVRWWQNAHRVLGMPDPVLPGDDFIGPMTLWERETVKVMTRQIETVSGLPWWQALARQRHFSEYLVYGAAVASDPTLAARHERVSQSRCLTYWVGPPLDRAGLRALIASLLPHQCAITIQSHTQTPIEIIREVAIGKG